MTTPQSMTRIILCCIFLICLLQDGRAESDYVLAQCGSGRCRTRGSIMDDKGHITFVSGNFFVPNMNFTTTIVTSHKSKVRISFEHFKMYGDQNTCLQKMDYMQIFDGTSTNAKVLTAPLCGTHEMLPDIYTSSNSFTIKVQLPYYFIYYGQFKLDFEAMEDDEHGMPKMINLQKGCSSAPLVVDIEEPYSEHYEIISHDPVLGPRYPDNINCSVLLRLMDVDEGGMKFTITWFTNIGEKHCDDKLTANHLAFYKGKTITDDPEKVFCKGLSDKAHFTIESTEVLLSFQSKQMKNYNFTIGGFAIEMYPYEPLSVGAIIGIVFGVLLGIALIVGFIVCCIICTNKVASKKGNVIMPPPGPGQPPVPVQYTNQAFVPQGTNGMAGPPPSYNVAYTVPANQQPIPGMLPSRAEYPRQPAASQSPYQFPPIGSGQVSLTRNEIYNTSEEAK